MPSLVVTSRSVVEQPDAGSLSQMSGVSCEVRETDSNSSNSPACSEDDVVIFEVSAELVILPTRRHGLLGSQIWRLCEL